MRYLFLLIFLFSATLIFAQAGSPTQSDNEIYGTILDSATNKGLEYASVVALRLKDSSLVNGCITDLNGNFSIKNLTYGKYYLKINYVGYKEKIAGPFSLNPSTGSSLNAGKIIVNISATSLSEVTITTEKPFIEMKLDKRVVNVEGNISTTGGTALDVLETIPSISVDMDGVVSLRGSENVTILIDGRPSTLTGGSRRASLEQIPANTIETVEIITNPSSKYDPAGTSGIINIVLKKRKGKNSNVIASADAGTGDKYSANINLSHNAVKFNSYINYNYNNSKRKTSSELFRQTYNFISNQYINQNSEGSSFREGNSIKAGGNYFINKNHSIGFSLNGNISDMGRNSFATNIEKDINEIITNEYTNLSANTHSHKSYDANLNYIGKFKKPEQKLNVDFNFSSGLFDSESSNFYNYITSETINYDKIISTSTNSNIFGKLDYVHPFGENKKLETGINVSMADLKSDDKYYSATNPDNLIYNDEKSNKFNFDENIFAIYGNYSQDMKKWSFSSGIRLEQVFSTPHLVSDTINYENNYFSIFPTAAITKKIKEGEDIQISYSKRINRPNNHDLNPFIDYSSFPMLRTGNPYLKPEYIHSIELGYIKIKKATTFMPSIFYRHTIDLITRYTKTYLDTLFLATFENAGKSDSYGIELIVSQALAKWWKLNLSGSFFLTQLNAQNIDTQLESESYSWTSRMNSLMKIRKSFEFQTNIIYNGPRIMPQGYRKAMFFVNIGLKYSTLKDKLQFSLSLKDVFNTSKFGAVMDDPAFYSTMNHRWESRVLTFGITYQLQSTGKKEGDKKKPDEGNYDEGF